MVIKIGYVSIWEGVFQLFIIYNAFKRLESRLSKGTKSTKSGGLKEWAILIITAGPPGSFTYIAPAPPIPTL